MAPRLVPLLVLLAACTPPGAGDWPVLVPLDALAAAPLPAPDTGDLLLREAALRARARLLSGEVLSAAERARLEAAAAAWPPG